MLARLAKEQGYERVGIMYLNNAYGEGLANQFEESFTALGGTITPDLRTRTCSRRTCPNLRRPRRADPDVLAVLSYTGQASVYVREAMEGGYADAFLFADGTKGSEWIDGMMRGRRSMAPWAPCRAVRAARQRALSRARTLRSSALRRRTRLWPSTTTPLC